MALSDDGGLVLTGSFDKTAIPWDVKSGEKLRTFAGHATRIAIAAMNKDGSKVLTGTDDGTVMLWDAKSAEEPRRLVGHSNRISGVAFGADGKIILSGSGDGTTKLWDARSAKELCSLISIDGGKDWLVITQDGLFDGSPPPPDSFLVGSVTRRKL